MFCERLHFTFVGVVATLADSVVVAEFAGYWLHRVLHGGKFPGHSWGHLMRHFPTPWRPAYVARLARADVQLLVRQDTQAKLWMTLKTQKTARPASPECGQQRLRISACPSIFGGLLRTMAKRHGPLKGEGFQAAFWRNEVDETEPLPLAICSAALFHRSAGRKNCPRKAYMGGIIGTADSSSP